MSWVLAEVALQRVIQIGLTELRQDSNAFTEIFAYYNHPLNAYNYGQKYIDQVYQWFTTIKMPVLQAWSFNAQRIPCVSIHLAAETEDESKAAMGDFHNFDPEQGEINVSVFTVNLDIGLHSTKSGDHVLWMYYIISYILFKKKLLLEQFGLRLQTWSATDWNRDPQYMTDIIWSRWIRFRCTVENFWEQNPLSPDIDEVDVAVIPEIDTDFI